MKKWIGLLIIVFAVGLPVVLDFGSISETLEQKISQDFNFLMEHGHIPEEYSKLSKVVVEKAPGKFDLNKLVSYFPIQDGSPYFLSIHIIQEPDGEKTQFVVQYDFLSIEKNEKVFELGRTFYQNGQISN